MKKYVWAWADGEGNYINEAKNLSDILHEVLEYYSCDYEDFKIDESDDRFLIQIDTDSLKTANGQTLLGIRVRVANKGNVPFKLYDSGKEELTLEVREVGKIEKGEWVNSSDQLPVANRSVFKTNSGPISIGLFSIMSNIVNFH